ncbi:hypothetical protein V6N13_120472 [Hibiscus sabdariffa]|uniref:Uncharacterized protein n=1 Tax=Hibiscus sabdariffa TaxID=183260 RepID=A0ABR2E4S0_9ROSI
MLVYGSEKKDKERRIDKTKKGSVVVFQRSKFLSKIWLQILRLALGNTFTKKILEGESTKETKLPINFFNPSCVYGSHSWLVVVRDGGGGGWCFWWKTKPVFCFFPSEIYFPVLNLE